ncbi:Dihydromonacolin L monooxygenase LovA 6 [Diaporthe amygdali]|uniref:Dihydromonacolin L monooxygenase LovA 6 n=1 Tax=Phomopsis amygdali TaxID=1214568 RepID=UPI0022FEC51C|nr:Dihydromonacolin L monooxygenase LovA 6 [Diaporthe amygdali]KAJ0122177.1 Dihydromonacolin L monooxygenase LovA 6 [Diaporthe amygdali]
MSLRASIQGALGDIEMADITAKPLPYVLVTFVFIVLVYSLSSKPKSNAPLLNPREAFEFSDQRAKGVFYQDCRALLRNWFDSHPSEPAQLITDYGHVTVLPPSMANEIRNDLKLSFADFSADFLAKITKPLADETALAIPASFGESKEWHSLPLRDTILTCIARISSRVFLGEELCRNEAWLKISREYATTVFPATDILRVYPAGIVRSIAARVLPICRAAQAQVAEARSILQPVLDRRAAAKAAAAADGKALEFNDAIDWFENAATKAKAKYDPAAMQLFLSIVAIHTTSDLMSQIMTDLAAHPEIIDDLRKEIKDVLSDGGWKKTTLTNMKLLDSVIKESQRLKPIQLATMQRKARADVKLSNGTFIPKGGFLAVSTHHHWDDATYPNANEWDGYRFYKMRHSGEPGKENTSQLVATTAEHLGFGHGIHACPGRFFAANEVKIALVFTLLNYDWRLPEGVKPKIDEFGVALTTDATVQVLVRKREDDFDLSAIE